MGVVTEHNLWQNVGYPLITLNITANDLSVLLGLQPDGLCFHWGFFTPFKEVANILPSPSLLFSLAFISYAREVSVSQTFQVVHCLNFNMLDSLLFKCLWSIKHNALK